MDGLLSQCFSITPFFLPLLFLLFLFFLLKLRLTPNRHSKLPLGSSGIPFIGETLSFVSTAYSPRPESFVERRRALYGKVFRSHLFGSPTIVSTDAEVSRFVLQSDAAAFRPSYPRSLTELMGESSILLLSGFLHRRVHGLIGAFLKSPQLKSQITSDMDQYLSSTMLSWNHAHLVLLQDEARQITFQVLAKVLISLEPGEELEYLKHEFKKFISGLMSLPVKLPGSRLYRSLQAKKRMVLLAKEIIRRKREKLSQEGCGPRDVADVLIMDGSDRITDQLIAQNVIDLMIPGEDSVPILITLAVKYLSASPRALRQIEEENLRLKESKGEDICWMDYMALQFTQDVISETLRLGNIIGGIMRKAMKDVEIKGYLIPKGWCVYTCFRSIHLDGTIYENPCEFNPWRWQGKDASTCHFTPFGGGQRLCPGLDLARLEASIFLHHLVTKFTWEAEEDKVISFPTVRMQRRMPIRVKRKEEEEKRNRGESKVSRTAP